MLVLTVREGDVIVVGDGAGGTTSVRIMVRQLKKGMFKACIDAPQEVVIRRLSAAEPVAADARFEDDLEAEAEAEREMPPAVFITSRRRRPGANRG